MIAPGRFQVSTKVGSSSFRETPGAGPAGDSPPDSPRRGPRRGRRNDPLAGRMSHGRRPGDSRDESPGFGTRTRVGVGTATEWTPACHWQPELGPEAFRSLSPGLPLQQARSAPTPSPKIGAESESGPLDSSEVPRFQVPFRVSLSPGRPCAFVCVCVCVRASACDSERVQLEVTVTLWH
jgi:hypothetical protein